MTEGLEGVGLEWTVRVEETFNALKWADSETQELACKSIEQERGGGEAGKKLRELFEAEADRMKAAAFFKNSVAQPSVETPKEPVAKPMQRLRRLGEKSRSFWRRRQSGEG